MKTRLVAMTVMVILAVSLLTPALAEPNIVLANPDYNYGYTSTLNTDDERAYQYHYAAEVVNQGNEIAFLDFAALDLLRWNPEDQMMNLVMASVDYGQSWSGPLYPEELKPGETGYLIMDLTWAPDEDSIQFLWNGGVPEPSLYLLDGTTDNTNVRRMNVVNLETDFGFSWIDGKITGPSWHLQFDAENPSYWCSDLKVIVALYDEYDRLLRVFVKDYVGVTIGTESTMHFKIDMNLEDVPDLKWIFEYYEGYREIMPEVTALAVPAYAKVIVYGH